MVTNWCVYLMWKKFYFVFFIFSEIEEVKYSTIENP